jgi:hypothetical protein
LIDIETTSIDPARDAIIEIASVDMVRDGRILMADRCAAARGSFLALRLRFASATPRGSLYIANTVLERTGSSH